MTKVSIHVHSVMSISPFIGKDVLKVLFGDRFYHEVESAGLLDPTVIRPKLSLQPSEPTQAGAEPQCMVLEVIETVCSGLTLLAGALYISYRYQIRSFTLNRFTNCCSAKVITTTRYKATVLVNSFAPKTSVGLGMRQTMHLCQKLLTLNCMINGTFRPNWWSEIRSTAEGDNRNQEYKAFRPPSR